MEILSYLVPFCVGGLMCCGAALRPSWGFLQAHAAGIVATCLADGQHLFLTRFESLYNVVFCEGWKMIPQVWLAVFCKSDERSF